MSFKSKKVQTIEKPFIVILKYALDIRTIDLMKQIDDKIFIRKISLRSYN